MRWEGPTERRHLLTLGRPLERKRGVMAKKKRFVVVTTAHKGVFGGYANGAATGKTIELTDAQMCVYWSADVHGVLGLAASGPSKSSRVTPAVPCIRLEDVTAVMDASAEAEAAWRKRPWA